MSDKPLALVIEDDFDAATIFATALKANGFETEMIHDGAEALKRLETVTPAVVVLDMHLPEVAGTDILRRIRANPAMKDTRVLVATADARMADTVEHLADLVLLKPITFSQVRDLAARLVSAR
ncbi:MAG: response regulator [Anaerolineae bacterium]|nr:response regulator [Anaerolineae bacterium]